MTPIEREGDTGQDIGDDLNAVDRKLMKERQNSIG